MDWSVSVESGVHALLNGAVSFAAALVLGAIFWGVYKFSKLTRLSALLSWVFSTLDLFLRKGVAPLTGVHFKGRLPRWSSFVALFSILAGLAALAPFPVAMGSIGFALIAFLSIYRLWERDEDKRLERSQTGKTHDDQQDLRDEMFIALGLLLFFVPIGYVRIGELTAITSGHSAYPSYDAALFVWGELTKALPLVDWSEVFRVRNLSGVESAGQTGIALNFGLRVLFDLMVLAGLLRTWSILNNQAKGLDIRKPEKELKSDDKTIVDKALDRIIEIALKERRNAIAHLFEITRGTRKDGRLNSRVYQEKAARALGRVADTMVENAKTLVDLDSILLAHEAYKVSAETLKPFDEKAWAKTQSDFGVTLSTLGEMSGDAGALEEAMKAFTKALEVFTKDALPADWAKTQIHFGNALMSLGQMSVNVEHIANAIAAYRKALKVLTQNALPAIWAGAQNNLGNALKSLGEMSGKAGPVEQAVQAYKKALEVRTKDAQPADWAMTQNNLGTALKALGGMSGQAEAVEQAVKAYRKALEIFTKDAQPAAWAVTQNNLGNALKALGEMSGKAEPVEQAVQAYRKALEVHTKNALPADWARTQNNLGTALKALGGMSGQAEPVEKAVKAYRKALEIFTKDAQPADWAMTQTNLGAALKALGGMSGQAEAVEQAVQAFRKALEVRTKDALPSAWAMTQNNLGIALAFIWNITSDDKTRKSALKAFEELRDWYLQQGQSDQASEIEDAIVQRKLRP